jgi:hypothetical protein
MAEKVAETPEKREVQEVRVERPKRARLTAEESLRRIEAFPERKEQIVAAVRKSKGRGLSP